MLTGVKKLMVARLKEALKPQGYKYYAEMPGFFRNVKHPDFWTEFFLSTSGRFKQQGISSMCVGFYEVEKYWMLNDLVPMNMESVRARKFARPTIILKIEGKRLSRDVDDLEDFELMMAGVEKYLWEHGFPFVEKYNTLEAVLERIDELHAEGKLWNGILAGGPEFFFKGLTISKLCDDPKFQDKLGYVEAQMPLLIGIEWPAAFRRMCEILEDVKPK